MEQERISGLGQIRVYIGKCWRSFLNEQSWKTFISSAIIAVIISWVIGEDTFYYFQETKFGAFALICACIWMGIFNSVQSICRERAIIKREHRTGLRISSYITAHMIYESFLCFIEALITASVLYIIRECPSEGIIMPAFFEIFITFFFVIFSADMLGMLVSSIVKNETQAMTVMPFVLILQLVMSGIMFKLEGAASAISNITISKWGVNAICSIANVNNMSGAIFVGSDDRASYDFTADNLLSLWLLLFIFALMYGIISIAVLKLFIDRDKR